AHPRPSALPADPRLRLGLGDLGAGRPLDDAADLLEVVLVVPRLLGEERGVGRNAVDDAERDQRLDILQVSGIDEQFHDVPPTGFVSSPTPATVIVTSSPGWSGPTPDGGPVATPSPGRSVITLVM